MYVIHIKIYFHMYFAVFGKNHIFHYFPDDFAYFCDFSKLLQIFLSFLQFFNLSLLNSVGNMPSKNTCLIPLTNHHQFSKVQPHRVLSWECVQRSWVEIIHLVWKVYDWFNDFTAGYVGRFDSCSQAELARLGWPLILCSKVTAQCREFGHLDNVRWH